MKFYLVPSLLVALSLSISYNYPPGIFFYFKGKPQHLRYPLQPARLRFGDRAPCGYGCLDSLSNRYLENTQYVEIIRLDHPTAPALGFALAFEFDETNGNYPYTPSFVVAQLKSYRWGGVEFSSSDSLNYSAVSNDVSDDISMEVDSFIQDTIYGHFSGLFLNGSGGMGGVESGTFKVKLHRH